MSQFDSHEMLWVVVAAICALAAATLVYVTVII